MSLQISTNHPTILLKTKIQEITQNFLESFGFSYFQYLRCFADGSVGLLTNETGLLEHFQHVNNAPVVFSSFENINENSPSYWFLWDEKLPKAPVELAREKFNIHNGLTLVRRSQHYYDMIAVGLSAQKENPGTFYLNKLKAIEQFIHDFDITHKDLISVMNKNPISLPEAYRDTNYKNICLTQGKMNVIGKHGPTYITTQELECLRLLLQNFSYKQIAKLLNISPRTVETYLLRVKQRTGLSTFGEFDYMIFRSSAA